MRLAKLPQDRADATDLAVEMLAEGVSLRLVLRFVYETGDRHATERALRQLTEIARSIPPKRKRGNRHV